MAEENEVSNETFKPELHQFMSLDHPKKSFYHDTDEIMHVSSLNIEEYLKPQPASQSPSQILPYVQSKTLIALQTPKTGIRLKRTSLHKLSKTSDSSIGFDPRQLQNELNALNDKFYIYDKKGHWYAIPSTKKKNGSKNDVVQKLTIEKLNKFSARRASPAVSKSPKNIKLELGYPVGVQLGSFGITDTRFSEIIRGKQGFACCLMAFGYIFLKPEKTWNTTVLDSISINGTELFKKSLNNEGKSNESMMNKFQVDGVDIEVNHDLPPIVNGVLKSQENGSFKIYHDLKKCIKKNKKYIFCCDQITLLIWKKLGYFVFDPNGRTKDCKIGTNPALITVKNVENIVHIILNLSNLNGNATYTLSTVTITKLGNKTAPSNPSYQVINSFRAILRYEYHLCHKRFRKTANKQSMPMSITSLIYTKIMPPNTWGVLQLKKIIMIGNDLCKKWSQGIKNCLTLKDLPSQFEVEQNTIKLKFVPFINSTLIKGDASQVSQVLKEAIVNNHRLLLQVKHMFFAVWMENQIYYLFDPYPRDAEGAVCIDESAQCCINMFSCINELSQHFRKNMLQIVPNEKMYVHVIEITDLQQLKKCSTDKEEVLSLTELLDLDSSSDLQANAVSDDHLNPDEIDQEGPVESSSTTEILCCPKSQKISPSLDYLITAQLYDIIGNLNLVLSPEALSKETELNILSPCTSEHSQIIAKKILIKSDLEKLQEEKKKIEFEDTPLPHEHCHCYNPVLSLSQELLIPTNFKNTPDGSGIIFGTRHIYNITDPVNQEYALPIVAIATVLSSYKYSIATWNSKVVDFVLDIASKMMEYFPEINTKLFTFVNHNFPLMEIGSNKYKTRIEMIKVCSFNNLSCILDKLFLKVQKLVILSPTSSVAVFKRKNFYYMYEAYPCNVVGLRAQQGTSCFMRFKSLLAMIRRLEANRKEIGTTDKVIISQIILTEITSFVYPEPSEKQKEEFLKNAELEHVYKNFKKQQKLDEIDALITEEQKRIKNFRISEPLRESENEFVLSENTSKHSFVVIERSKSTSKSNKKYKTAAKHFTMNYKPSIGYKQCNEDLLWKIQGSTSLQDRCASALGQVKTCYFTCIYALMYVMHEPIEKWNHRNVDICIENGKSMFEQIPSLAICMTREIENLQIGDILYHIAVSNTFCSTSLWKCLQSTLQRNNYLILQFQSCTFALYKDKLYHIFDPYPSVEYCTPPSQKEIEDIEKRKAQFQGTLVTEKNKASWILCYSMNDILNYISKRVSQSDIQKDYIVYVIKILNYKKAPKNSKIDHLLYKSSESGNSLNMICGVNVEPKLPDDNIQFLESIDIPPWSRLKTFNIEKRKRGIHQTTWKEYDIEVSNELYSLWSEISPYLSIFKENRGNQYLAINAIAIAMSSLYPLDEWNSEILNSIVVHGDRYFTESMPNTKEEFDFSDLNSEYEMDDISFQFNFEPIVVGSFYDSSPHNFNLSRALTYFFREHTTGILSTTNRAIAIGKEKTYFMFDCQSFGKPLFKRNQGAAYILRCCSLKRLSECLLVALNIRRYCVKFVIYETDVKIGQNGDDNSVEDDENEHDVSKHLSGSSSEANSKNKSEKGENDSDDNIISTDLV